MRIFEMVFLCVMLAFPAVSHATKVNLRSLRILRHLANTRDIYKGLSLAQIYVHARVARLSNSEIEELYEKASEDQLDLIKTVIAGVHRVPEQTEQHIEQLYKMRELLPMIDEADWQAAMPPPDEGR